ncbi:ABC transporter ATP-binding protein [Metabacillus sp. GX 13764]|uniref:ABC transporter ATP-binding protein n=1 Tax=Metabacillus kandeliae TaxID=2900151 RepID=UPI001E4B84F1|nr:ABC transporter ATP-binding protein [Metabacillus kandeliae]MCD7036033.1 ABC transporter ATP-binding protein [Metabacillus kandeliae]
MAKLTVKDLTKIYEGKLSFQALKEVNFTIEDGEFAAVMGPSGSGKTTLLNVLSTIDQPTSGEVILGESHPHHLAKNELALFRRRELGFVFQDFNLLNTLTVKENMVLGLTLDGRKVREMNEKAGELAEKLGISRILNKRTYEISGGQAQRTAIARAIIHKPQLLLADEPTGNLDSKSARDVLDILAKINREIHTTMMMVTHDPLAASYCSRVMFMKDGVLVSEARKGNSQEKFYQEIIQEISRMEKTNAVM